MAGGSAEGGAPPCTERNRRLGAFLEAFVVFAALPVPAVLAAPAVPAARWRAPRSRAALRFRSVRMTARSTASPL